MVRGRSRETTRDRDKESEARRLPLESQSKSVGGHFGDVAEYNGKCKDNDMNLQDDEQRQATVSRIISP